MEKRSINDLLLYDAGTKTWLFFSRPLKILAASDIDSVEGVLREVEQEVQTKRLHAAGFVSYEAAPAFDSALVAHPADGFPLVWFGIYNEPKPVRLPALSEFSAACYLPVTSWTASISPDEYSRSLQKIKKWIKAGDTYQVNYSFRLRAFFNEDPWLLFMNMIYAQENGYGAFVNTDMWTICSASPELFFTLSGDQLICRPMKGTMPRAMTYREDQGQAGLLADSVKNRAENVMIVDMVRNDMSRICNNDDVDVTGLYDIEKYPTLWQMTSSIRCTTKAGIADIFRALFPAASITGAPKVRTMQIIAQLESTPRKIYTGAIGFLSPDSRAQFNVAIRTVVINKRDGAAEYGAGGGIVWDSQERDELAECYTKAKILTKPVLDFQLLETILWRPDGGYYLLQEHLNRLTESAAYFTYSVDYENICMELEKKAGVLPPHPHKIRLLLSREGKLELQAERLVSLPTPYRIGLAKSPVDKQDPFLYHKTTHRLVYDRLLQAAPEFDDLLLWNDKGEITESCRANIIIELGGVFLTPPVSCGLLAGTFRSHLLRQNKIKEGIIHIEDLNRCTTIYLGNALRGLWKVFPEVTTESARTRILS